jgi:serine/threonine protein kinase
MRKGPEALIGKSFTIEDTTVVAKCKIGEGGYGVVYRAEDAKGVSYAFKYVNALTPDRYNQFRREALILKALPPHENIVKVAAATMNDQTYQIYILYEFCVGGAIPMSPSLERRF